MALAQGQLWRTHQPGLNVLGSFAGRFGVAYIGQVDLNGAFLKPLTTSREESFSPRDSRLKRQLRFGPGLVTGKTAQISKPQFPCRRPPLA